MKKKYLKPNAEVIKMKIESPLLSFSDGETKDLEKGKDPTAGMDIGINVDPWNVVDIDVEL